MNAVFEGDLKAAPNDLTINKEPDFRLLEESETPDSFLFDKEFERNVHYLQSPEWFNSHSENRLIAGSFLNGKLVARSVINKRRIPCRLGYIYKIERGPASPSIEALKSHITELVKKLAGTNTVIEINPYSEDPVFIAEIDLFLQELGWVGTKGTRSFYRNSVVVDLRPEIDDIHRSFRKSLRRRINSAAKSEICTKFTNSTSTIRELLRQFNHVAKNRGFKPLSANDKNYILKGVDKGSIKVCAVYFGNECLGGNIMVLMQDRVLAEWGVFSSKPEHRKFPLAHLVDWDCIQWSKANGYSFFDFAGYWLEQGDENTINLYKTGFTKNITAVTPEYDYYHSSRFVKILLDYSRYRQKNKIKVFNRK